LPHPNFPRWSGLSTVSDRAVFASVRTITYDGQRRADLTHFGDDGYGFAEVGAREAQEVVAGVQKGILPLKVGVETVFVVGAVVLDGQPTILVVEVYAADEPSVAV